MSDAQERWVLERRAQRIERIERDLAEVDEQIVDLVRMRRSLTAELWSGLPGGSASPAPRPPDADSLIERWTAVFGGPGELVARALVNVCWLTRVAAVAPASGQVRAAADPD
jgi:hypothetical protein